MEETRDALAPANGAGRKWLVALGGMELVLVALSLSSAFVVLRIRLSRPEGPLMGSVSVSPGVERGIRLVLWNLRTAALFAVLGWGLFRGRRWARSIQQALCGLWLLQAVVYLPVSLMRLFPRYLFQGLRPEAPVLYFSFVSSLVAVAAYLVLPLAFHRVLRRPGVRAACEALDPVRGWTDARSPLMVTALVLLGLSAIDLLVLGQSAFVPARVWFGLGVPDLPLRIVLAAGLAALTVGVYRRNRRTAQATLLVLGIGTLVGLVRMPFSVEWHQLPGALRAAFGAGSWIDRIVALEPWRPLVSLLCTLALWIVILITLLPLPRSLAVVEEPETIASQFS